MFLEIWGDGLVNTGVELPRLSLYHTDFLMYISSSFNNPSSIYTHTHKKQKKKKEKKENSEKKRIVRAWAADYHFRKEGKKIDLLLLEKVFVVLCTSNVIS